MTAQSPRRLRRTAAAAALVAASAAFLASESLADSQTNTTCDAASAQAPAKAEVAPAGVTSGMRVSIDPKTGAYTDAPVDAQAAGARITAGAEAPKPVPLEGGGEMLDTSGFLHEMTATAAHDGRVRTNCVQASKPAAPVE